MSLRNTTIRGKITAAFVLSFSFLLLVAASTFVTLLAIEDEVGLYAGTSRLLDATLEMRRYEKNYLLYRQHEDLDAAVRYAGTAAAQAAERPDGDEAGRLLREYRALLEGAAQRDAAPAAPGEAPLEAGIRDLGRKITGIAERLSAAEARRVHDMLRAGRVALVLLVAVFLLGTALIARMVVLTALRPLKELERAMRRIASGDDRLLPEGSRDHEIASVNAAFNRMIREVFARRQEARQAERLAFLGTALAGIAHEINNPLSNVSTSAELLREEGEEATAEERRRLVDQIIAQTDRATGIIRTVLDFSREPRAGPRPTPLLPAVRGALILVERALPAHVSVSLDVAPDLVVLADRPRLEQAFINLLSNAFDAMRDAGRESNLVVSARRAGDEDVEIVFRDTGGGIPRHVVDRIFDPFFTTKDVGRGTGLGLYVTHQIVEQHGGSIRVESAEGEGTAVIVLLPGGEARAAAGERALREGVG